MADRKLTAENAMPIDGSVFSRIIDDAVNAAGSALPGNVRPQVNEQENNVQVPGNGSDGSLYDSGYGERILRDAIGSIGGRLASKPEKTSIPDRMASEIHPRISSEMSRIESGERRRDDARGLITGARNVAGGIADVASEGPAAIIDGDGILNPENWLLIGKTDKDREKDREKEEHRASNPMPDGAMEDGRVSGDMRSGYESLFERRGGLEEGYETGLDQIGRSISEGTFDEYGSYIPAPDMLENVREGVDKISRENFDDGTMRSDSVKAKYMTGQQYIDYQNEVGTGGRPIDQIDPTAVYDKEAEMRDWNFVPYIVDDDQDKYWSYQDVARGPSDFFSEMSNVRSKWTDATIDYGGNKISRDSFIDAMDKFDDDSVTDEMFYYENLVPAGSDVPDSAVPLWFNWFYVDPDTGERYEFDTTSDYNLAWHPDGDGRVVLYFDDIEGTLEFGSYDEVVDAIVGGDFSYETTMVDSRDQANMFAPMVPSIEVDGPNGPVTLGYNDMRMISKMYDDGTLDIDYGPLNIAKDASERKEWTESLGSGDVLGFLGDLVPGSVDMTTSSAPLWISQTAYPQALSGALTNLQGIDRNSYDSENGTYRRVSDTPSGDSLLSSTAGAALIPFTEKFAGGFGRGVLNKPVQRFLSKAGIPAAIRYAADDVGEGVEEVVASPVEELEAYGASEMFADPVLDENGEVMYGDDYKEIRDPNTPFFRRIANFLEQAPENYISGHMLGAEIGAVPRTMQYASTVQGKPQGYFADSYDRKMSDRFSEKMNLPKFRKMSNHMPDIVIRPEDIGSFSFEKEEAPNGKD